MEVEEAGAGEGRETLARPVAEGLQEVSEGQHQGEQHGDKTVRQRDF